MLFALTLLLHNPHYIDLESYFCVAKVHRGLLQSPMSRVLRLEFYIQSPMLKPICHAFPNVVSFGSAAAPLNSDKGSIG